MKFSLILFLTLVIASANAGVERAWDILVKSNGRTNYYPSVINELVKDELYFTSVPYIKEYLIRTEQKIDKSFDTLIDNVVTRVGVKQFEVMPEKYLNNSRAPMIRYILARKYFRKKEYAKVLEILNGSIPRNHSAKSFSLFLEGSAFSILGKYSSAKSSYEDCIKTSEKAISNVNDEDRVRQLKINRDYCVVGIARTQFAQKDFDSASSSYLDLKKTSYIWPEILFEEAWTSFYQKDYNRTLGKLVTYKAPILDFIFNPEIEVLKALTYMELCLWDDTKKVVNEFYQRYQNDHRAISSLLSKHGKDYKYYYLMMKTFSSGKNSGVGLLNTVLSSIKNDPAYRELMFSFNMAKNEIEKNKKLSNRLQSVFNKNLRDSLLLQRDLVGAYVRKGLLQNLKMLDKSFEGMSYIKLEVLSRKKAELYDFESKEARSRGDIRYLKRNEKQYFWSFNGEFWADELGDYVFSLKSECGS